MFSTPLRPRISYQLDRVLKKRFFLLARVIYGSVLFRGDCTKIYYKLQHNISKKTQHKHTHTHKQMPRGSVTTAVESMATQLQCFPVAPLHRTYSVP